MYLCMYVIGLAVWDYNEDNLNSFAWHPCVVCWSPHCVDRLPTFNWMRGLRFFTQGYSWSERGSLFRAYKKCANCKATCNGAKVSLTLEMVYQSPASYLHPSLGCNERSDINYSWCLPKHPSDDSCDPCENKGLCYKYWRPSSMTPRTESYFNSNFILRYMATIFICFFCGGL